MFNILFVDDEDELRSNVHRFLSKRGYKVFLAKNGVEGEQIIKSEKIEVIVSDISMPEMDGIQFLKVAKEHNPDVCFIILTAHGTKETAIKAVEYGAYRFLEKPFKMSELDLIIDSGYNIKKLKEDNSELTKTLQDAYGILKELNELYQKRLTTAESILLNLSELTPEEASQYLMEVFKSGKLETLYSKIKGTIDRHSVDGDDE